MLSLLPATFPRPEKLNLRNIAIIARVDHGKTTLVDQLLKQSGAFRDNQRVAERAMDSNDLEKERTASPSSPRRPRVDWHGTHISIVDTPGHADFGGEVERILSMVDCAIVLVDAAEGRCRRPSSSVGKALKVGLRPIVVINKIDRPDARHVEVVNEVFDLFAALATPPTSSSISRSSTARGATAGFPRIPGRSEDGASAAVRPRRQACAGAGRSIQARSADRHHLEANPFWPHHHRPHSDPAR
ncbi:GTP-binding protein [Mesorhizobium atlanticum]